MDWQNLSYAAIQIAHNFGAVAVVGGALFALWPARLDSEIQRKLGWVELAGWAIQGASGGAFGAASYFWYGQFPDIHGLAIAALLIKMVCALAGFLLAAAYLLFAGNLNETSRRRIWAGLLALGATALAAAALLRWFS